MRVGVAATRIITSTQLETGVVESDDILDGTIVNIDIAAAAAIAYSKLNLTGLVVNADIAAAAAIVSTKLDLTAIAQVITPDADGTRDLGTTALNFGTVHAADASGGLKALFLMGM